MSDLAELFSRDPQEMSDKDIDTIIDELRKKRAQFKASGSPQKMPKVSEAAVKAAKSIDIGDLGL